MTPKERRYLIGDSQFVAFQLHASKQDLDYVWQKKCTQRTTSMSSSSTSRFDFSTVTCTHISLVQRTHSLAQLASLPNGISCCPAQNTKRGFKRRTEWSQ